MLFCFWDVYLHYFSSVECIFLVSLGTTLPLKDLLTHLAARSHSFSHTNHLYITFNLRIH